MSSYEGNPDHASQMVALLVEGFRSPRSASCRPELHALFRTRDGFPDALGAQFRPHHNGGTVT